MNQDDHQRIVELTGLLFDEIITDEQSAELNVLLKKGTEQRDIYRLTLSVLQSLQADAFSSEEANAPNVALPAAVSDQNTSDIRPRLTQPARLLSLTAAVAALVGLLFVTWQTRPEVETTAVASVTDAIEVKWASAQDAKNEDSSLLPGDHLRVASGVLTIAFDHGVVTTIEGPAHVTVDHLDQITLHQGRLATYVPQQAIGFRVSTPTAEVVDLGTEFGVEVIESGEAEVHVFEGEVEVSPQGTDSAEVVLAGASRAVDKNGNVQAGEVNERPFEATRDALHRRWLIRNGFNSGNGKKYASQYPGRWKTNEWTGPWQVAIKGEGATTHSATVMTGADGELQQGCGNRLSVQATSGSEDATLSIRRELELPADLPWNDPVFIDFLMRIETDLKEIGEIRLQGTSAAAEDGHPLILWDISSERNDNGELLWTAGGVEEPTITLLPVSQDTCRHIFKYTAGRNSWHVHVIRGDDVGKSFVKCKDRRRLPRLDGRFTLNWEVDIPAGQTFALSLDSIRIHARPAPPPPDN